MAAMGREAWRVFLRRWSGEYVAAHDPERDTPIERDVLRDRWLGFAPAGEADVAAAEARLGRALPPSLREFLLVTDGWRHAGNFIYRLAGAAELDWLADTDDAHWISAYGGDEVEDAPEADGDEDGDEDEDDLDEVEQEQLRDGIILRRSLRISLAGDAAVMLLDPGDVDEDGEWAGYWLASWSGNGPERHNSFQDLMYDQYVRFHGLTRPPGETRDHWDAEVERARLAALGGEVDAPLAVLTEASRFGRDRAGLLRMQLLGMTGDWYSAQLDHVVMRRHDRDALLSGPLFAAELLPLLLVESRMRGYGENLTLGRLRKAAPASVRALIEEQEARAAEPGFQRVFGTPEFDAAVHRVLDPLAADPAFRVHAPEPSTRAVQTVVMRLTTGSGAEPAAVRSPSPMEAYAEAGKRQQVLIDASWPALRETLSRWRPLCEDHIAPVSLLADPILARMITRERGREILSRPRG